MMSFSPPAVMHRGRGFFLPELCENSAEALRKPGEGNPGNTQGKPRGCSGSAEGASGTLNVYTLTYYMWSLPAGCEPVLTALGVKVPTKDFR